MTKEYLEGEEPERSKLVGVISVVTVDGTDTKVEKNQKDSTVAALEYGSNNFELGTWSLNLATVTCLAFEYTVLGHQRRQFMICTDSCSREKHH